MRTGESAVRQQGYGLVAVLLILALTALGLSEVGEGWVQSSRRDKEQELLRVGQLYAKALTRYRDLSPGGVKQLPNELSELLMDKRFVGTVRHIRELYPDPVSHGESWVVIRAEDGRVLGVRSSSAEKPLIDGKVRLGSRSLPAANRYSEWQFLVDPSDVVQSPSTFRARSRV